MDEQSTSDAIVELLQALQQFRQVPREDLVELVAGTRALRFEAETEVFRQGQPGLTALLVLTGKLEASVTSGGREMSVGHCHPGEIVGESALLGRESIRNATLRASEGSICLVLTPGLLDRRGNRAVAVLEQHLVSTLARRVRRTNLAIKQVWRKDPVADVAAHLTPAPTLRERLRAMFGGLS